MLLIVKLVQLFGLLRFHMNFRMGFSISAKMSLNEITFSFLSFSIYAYVFFICFITKSCPTLL